MKFSSVPALMAPLLAFAAASCVDRDSEVSHEPIPFEKASEAPASDAPAAPATSGAPSSEDADVVDDSLPDLSEMSPEQRVNYAVEMIRSDFEASVDAFEGFLRILSSNDRCPVVLERARTYVEAERRRLEAMADSTVARYAALEEAMTEGERVRFSQRMHQLNHEMETRRASLSVAPVQVFSERCPSESEMLRVSIQGLMAALERLSAATL